MRGDGVGGGDARSDALRRAARCGLAVACALLAGACVAPPVAGAACSRDGDCAAPLACRYGRCRSACSANRDCGATARCFLDESGFGVCALETDLGCESGGVGRACADGLICVADRCAQRCSSSLGCATGSVCTTLGSASFCTSPAEVPDAAVPDAEVLVSPCDRVVDLTGADAGSGPVVYVTDTALAPVDGLLTLVACTMGAPRVAHQIALRYRMQSDAYLRVDTRRPGTAANFDTVAAVFATCGPAMQPLGCNDDYEGQIRARAQTPDVLTGGTEVIVGVGGYDPSSTGVSAGPLEVAIQEVLAVASSGACDPAGVGSWCTGSACVTVRSGQGLCVDTVGETEDNARATPQLVDVTGPGALIGDLSVTDEDCFAFDVPALGSVVAVASDAHGECPSFVEAVTLRLYDATGAIVAEALGDAAVARCPPIDGTASGPAHGLPVGRYTLCATGTGTIDPYVLGVSVLP